MNVRKLNKWFTNSLLSLAVLGSLISCDEFNQAAIPANEPPIVDESSTDNEYYIPGQPSQPSDPQPTKPTYPPIAPSLTLVNKTSTSITLAYMDESEDEHGFRVERQKADESWHSISQLIYADKNLGLGKGKVRTVTDDGPDPSQLPNHSGLLHGAEYCYRVIVWNEHGSRSSNPLCTNTTSGIEPINLRLLTQNVYGQGKDCAARGRKFGEIVAQSDIPYDIIGVQEYFDTWDFELNSCWSKHLSEAIWSTGRYTEPNNYYRFYPAGEWWQGDIDGGVGIFSLHPIVKFNEWEWSARNSLREHGFIFARIQIPNTSLTVDTYIVHLHAKSDGCDQSCRQQELQQLARKISELSRDSGNPVIVMGDFNIGGPPSYNGNASYEDILQTLGNPRDLWWETHQGNPSMDGHTTDECGVVTTFECKEGSERIDYIFVLTDPRFTRHPYEISVIPGNVWVTKWKWVSGYPPVHRISDHFGVEATIEIR